MLRKKNVRKVYATFGIAILIQVNNFNKSQYNLKSYYVHKNCAYKFLLFIFSCGLMINVRMIA